MESFAEEQRAFIEGLGYVDYDVLGVIAEIQRIWPRLRVQYLDPDRFADLTDAPWRIVEMTPRGPVVVMEVWNLDKSVIDKIWAADDTRRGNDITSRIKKQQEVAELNRLAKEEEARLQQKDIVQTGIKHLNHHPRFTFRDDEGELREVKGKSD